MQSKFLYMLFLVALTVTVVGFDARSTHITANSNNAEAVSHRVLNYTRTPISDPTGTIVGQQNPELIPDRSAYSILFIVLARRDSDVERANAQAYLRRFNLQMTDSDIESFRAIANEYWSSVTAFDRQAKQIKDGNWPRPSAQILTRLRNLQAQKEALVDAKSAELWQRLSPDGKIVLTNTILSHIKSRVKVTPGPQSLPGGPDWKPAHH